VDYLVAGQRAPGSPKRTETLAGLNPPLDDPAVLLQDIIEVWHRAVLAAGVHRSFTLELSDRGRVRAVTVGVDDTRHEAALPSQGFRQEALCCGRVLPGREQEVEGRAGGVHSPVEVAPLAFDPYVGFVDAPTIARRLEVPCMCLMKVVS
jgi:hypothetical protein